MPAKQLRFGPPRANGPWLAASGLGPMSNSEPIQRFKGGVAFRDAQLRFFFLIN